MTRLSILILTLNEELNLGACLDSVTWSNDIVVLDSFSTDGTVLLAQNRGARVVQRRFDDYASQRNFGLQQVCYQNPWVLMLDADERVPVELHDELEKTIPTLGDDATLLTFRRKDFLYGRWLRRSSGYPTWFGRVARLGRVWVERPTNEEYHTDGAIVKLATHLDHYPFNKGISAWIIKHDRYSTMEARLLFEQGRQRQRLRDLFASNPTQARRALKALLYALPARPLIVFLLLYVVRGGVFDGRAGLIFSLLRSWYEFMINLKLSELRRRERGLPV